MKRLIHNLVFFFAAIVFISCDSNDGMGKFREIGLEKNYILFSGENSSSATVQTKEQGWAIGGVFVKNAENTEPVLHANSSHLRVYEDGSKIVLPCDTMVYEWIELIKVSPTTLKISIQENPSTQKRSMKVWLQGLVGYSGEELTIEQKGNN